MFKKFFKKSMIKKTEKMIMEQKFLEAWKQERLEAWRKSLPSAKKA